MKKIFYYILASFVATGCLFGVGFFFYSDNILAEVLNRTLKLKISSGYIGGEVIEDIFDSENDDSGDGTLLYPEYSAFKNGSLDLIRYTVHKPVYDAKWQANPEYWQLDFEFKSGTNDLRNILVYIATDNNESCSTEPLFENDEIQFDKSHPWNYALIVNESKSAIYNSNNQIVCETENYCRKNGKEILVRIPLKDKDLQKIYTARKTYHYVITGAYSKYEDDCFIHNSDNKTIYDILDTDTSQKNQLTSKTLRPVEITMEVKKTDKKADKNFITDIKNRYNSIAQQSAAASTPSYSPELTAAIESFHKNDLETAEKQLEAILKSESNNAAANAYYGSITAIKGGRTNPMAAMKLVNKAFIYLDKAVTLASGTEDEFEVRLNRAEVASSVPETVFKKSQTAAEDYLRLAELYKGRQKKFLLYRK